MTRPKIAQDSTPAFFGCTLLFLGSVAVWNVVNLWLLDISAQQRSSLAMGVLAAMFATMVLCKVVRDRQEATELVNEVRAARYEQVLAAAPAPGLGEL
jgi:hypothetical protein